MRQTSRFTRRVRTSSGPATSRGARGPGRIEEFVYAFDRHVTSLGGGAYRSTDRGVTWEKVHTHQTGYMGWRDTGHIIADPFHAGHVYVMDVTGVYRSTNANTASAGSITWTQVVDQPYLPCGGDFDTDGTLYIASCAGESGTFNRLLKVTTPAAASLCPDAVDLPGGGWSDIADGLWRSSAMKVNHVQLQRSEWRLYATQRGAGMLTVELVP